MAKKDPMVGLPEGHLTLDEARAVVNAHREAERAAERDKLLPLMGRYFKYRNNYGISGKGGWWLYAHVTGVDGTPMCTGWTFQRDENGRIEIEPNGRSTITIRPEGSGWQEIKAAEFWKAAEQIKASVNAHLSHRSRRTLRRRRVRSK